MKNGGMTFLQGIRGSERRSAVRPWTYDRGVVIGGA